MDHIKPLQPIIVLLQDEIFSCAYANPVEYPKTMGNWVDLLGELDRFIANNAFLLLPPNLALGYLKDIDKKGRYSECYIAHPDIDSYQGFKPHTRRFDFHYDWECGQGIESLLVGLHKNHSDVVVVAPKSSVEQIKTWLGEYEPVFMNYEIQ
jgi:hypothetical protein